MRISIFLIGEGEIDKDSILIKLSSISTLYITSKYVYNKVLRIGSIGADRSM